MGPVLVLILIVAQTWSAPYDVTTIAPEDTTILLDDTTTISNEDLSLDESRVGLFTNLIATTPRTVDVKAKLQIRLASYLKSLLQAHHELPVIMLNATLVVAEGLQHGLLDKALDNVVTDLQKSIQKADRDTATLFEMLLQVLIRGVKVELENLGQPKIHPLRDVKDGLEIIYLYVIGNRYRVTQLLRSSASADRSRTVETGVSNTVVAPTVSVTAASAPVLQSSGDVLGAFINTAANVMGRVFNTMMGVVGGIFNLFGRGNNVVT